MTKKSMEKHTPTPWWISESNAVKYGDADAYVTIMGKVNGAPWGIGSVTIARPQDAEMQSANAAFIVRTVNAHDELVDTLRMIAEEPEVPSYMRNAAKEAIAKSEGTSLRSEGKA